MSYLSPYIRGNELYHRGRLWCIWRPFSLRKRIAIFLRHGYWQTGEWIEQ